MWIGKKLGVIYGAWAARQPDDADHPGMEEVADDDPALLAFLAPKPIDPRVVTDTAEQDAAKADATILTLINQTRAEWATWAGANFPSLTQAERTRLGVLFWVVAVGVRKSLR